MNPFPLVLFPEICTPLYIAFSSLPPTTMLTLVLQVLSPYARYTPSTDTTSLTVSVVCCNIAALKILLHG